MSENPRTRQIVRQVVERLGLYPLAAWGLRRARGPRHSPDRQLVARCTVVQSAETSSSSPDASEPPDAWDDSLYIPPARNPSHDLVWQETHSNAQSMQFMIDCLPTINKLLASFPDDQPVRVE